MDEYFVKLDWDSEFFGFNVAKITCNYLKERQMSEVLRYLNERKFRLVYWSLPAASQEMVSMAQRMGGLLVDEKVTFVRNIRSPRNGISDSESLVQPYVKEAPEEALINLALSSGDFSRFKVDSCFPAELFVKLYTAWITRSVRKEIAWQVLVAVERGVLHGMVTLGERAKRGDIGLLAVAASARGKGIGKQLIAAADREFYARGYEFGQVVTQRANIPACRLYEVCGYKVDKIENVLHFWI